MKKRNPLKGLAAFEAKVAKSPVRVSTSKTKETEVKHEKKEPQKSKKERVKKEHNNMGTLNMAEFKRQFKKEREHLYN